MVSLQFSRPLVLSTTIARRRENGRQIRLLQKSVVSDAGTVEVRGLWSCGHVILCKRSMRTDDRQSTDLLHFSAAGTTSWVNAHRSPPVWIWGLPLWILRAAVMFDERGESKNPDGLSNEFVLILVFAMARQKHELRWATEWPRDVRPSAIVFAIHSDARSDQKREKPV